MTNRFIILCTYYLFEYTFFNNKNIELKLIGDVYFCEIIIQKNRDSGKHPNIGR